SDKPLVIHFCSPRDGRDKCPHDGYKPCNHNSLRPVFFVKGMGALEMSPKPTITLDQCLARTAADKKANLIADDRCGGRANNKQSNVEQPRGRKNSGCY